MNIHVAIWISYLFFQSLSLHSTQPLSHLHLRPSSDRPSLHMARRWGKNFFSFAFASQTHTWTASCWTRLAKPHSRGKELERRVSIVRAFEAKRESRIFFAFDQKFFSFFPSPIKFSSSPASVSFSSPFFLPHRNVIASTHSLDPSREVRVKHTKKKSKVK